MHDRSFHKSLDRHRELELANNYIGDVDKVIRELCHALILPGNEYNRDLFTILQLIRELKIHPADLAVENLIQVGTFTSTSGRNLFDLRLGKELLFVKLVRSIVRLKSSSWSNEKVNDLVTQLRIGSVYAVPLNYWEEMLQHAVGPRLGKSFSVIRSLTVTKSERPFENVRLGLVIYAIDQNDSVWIRVRIVEHKTPSGEIEWDIGVLTQNIQDGRITTPIQRKHFPVEKYPGLGLQPLITIHNGITEVAQSLGIYTLDLTPVRYETYHLITRLFGAVWDSNSPTYNDDKGLYEHIEKHLDEVGIGLKSNQGGRAARRSHYLLERSWYVFDGKVLDPTTRRPGLKWHKPRIVLALPKKIG